MVLKEIEYSEFVGRRREWSLSATSFNQVNLIVGKNASGKTRMMNVMRSLANLISGNQSKLYDSGSYKASFEQDGETYQYELCLEKYKVVSEKLTIAGKIRIDRKGDDIGKMFNSATGKLDEFQAPSDQIVIASRRDKLQHPYMDPLHEWAKSVRLYLFGSLFGKGNVKTAQQFEVEDEADAPANPDLVLDIFRRGSIMFGDEFKSGILTDFRTIGYDCTDIGVMNISRYIREKLQLMSIFVQENDLSSETTQSEMSQGMWRALALLIHLNFIERSGQSGCILIDDIGEGLDFSRSSLLLSVIIERAREREIQLFMTTNDKFIMNGVPLKYWSILHRDGPNVTVFNERNTEKSFKDFEFVGLSNFDFFTSEFFLGDK